MRIPLHYGFCDAMSMVREAVRTKRATMTEGDASLARWERERAKRFEREEYPTQADILRAVSRGLLTVERAGKLLAAL